MSNELSVSDALNLLQKVIRSAVLVHKPGTAQPVGLTADDFEMVAQCFETTRQCIAGLQGEVAALKERNDDKDACLAEAEKTIARLNTEVAALKESISNLSTCEVEVRE